MATPPALTPAQIRDGLLRELRRARKAMVSREWDEALATQPEDVQMRAGIAGVNVANAILKLENAALADIRDQLKANETEIAKGIAGLEKATADIKKVAKLLKAIDAALGVILKIVDLVPIGL